MTIQNLKFRKLKKELPGVQKKTLLSEHTTFKIGGPAKYFFIAKNKNELIEAIKWAKEKKLPLFVLGGGSNVLALDQGFDGLVIKVQSSNFKIFTPHQSKDWCGAKSKIIYAEAGAGIKDLVELTERKSLTGFEWAAGIPGTIGGAVYGNAQAFDGKMSDAIKSVEILDAKNFKIKNLLKKQCQLSLKNSIFKKNKDFIILSVILKLKKGDKRKIQKKIKENLDLRRRRHPLNFPSAGSVFINKSKKFPSSFLIEQCGLKGKRVGDAYVSEKHSGFIVNLGKAKAKDILELIKIIKKEVRKKFKINLKEEIRMIK
ncbi:MAG: UDP-N-acetylmuramate dehydrogenase [Candidatus Nealsonbacteria bacterium]|nr:UDP-N-acetylmuramate dehydrogenase [Candidatus Nealsonbacteria bacterium]